MKLQSIFVALCMTALISACGGGSTEASKSPAPVQNQTAQFEPPPSVGSQSGK